MFIIELIIEKLFDYLQSLLTPLADCKDTLSETIQLTDLNDVTNEIPEISTS